MGKKKILQPRQKLVNYYNSLEKIDKAQFGMKVPKPKPLAMQQTADSFKDTKGLFDKEKIVDNNIYNDATKLSQAKPFKFDVSDLFKKIKKNRESFLYYPAGIIPEK